ncbi:GTP 3',8-cyclase MoaA [Beijerinckia mobilis]|uniref:GTP 3',8-cyclase MoaA n=1 Tax=Beijerinckia mobilis TaxID=231434 RepID=UPI000551C0F1|nr:GTP 3',8-cyclase MoaA [Beijerinckia mobilis]
MTDPLIDPFRRRISYLRVSVTDRCDMRCLYCMAEDMVFLPRSEVLSLEELERLCKGFIATGVRRLRITGGEPLLRRGIDDFLSALGSWIGRAEGPGLDELTLTTNGSQLALHADALAAAGIKRINVSLDTLDPARFSTITRTGKLQATLDGITAARESGLAVRVNTVAMREVNEDEFDDLIAWCGAIGADLCLIETMPMGEVGENRVDRYLPLSLVRSRLAHRWTLEETRYETGGPARYVHVRETGRRLGFITPMTHGFCESCNRVRMTCTGKLYLCLGHEDYVDLKQVLRSGTDETRLIEAIRAAIGIKPKGHEFDLVSTSGTAGNPARHMSITGG